ncbi:MAG: hypothetical protein GVY05_08305 [Bacteroidetes bacterium]|jgi:hypothetical protein|nr:hypothetical protein [Bacteroidota bacterium]
MRVYFVLLISLISLTAISQEYVLRDENQTDKTYIQQFIQQSIAQDMLKENPLVIVDDKVVTHSKKVVQLDFFKSDIMEISFKPKNQSEWIKKYGAQAVNGVIEISTRPFYAKPINTVKGYAEENILFMVDGKVVSQEDIHDLQPNDIDNIEVVKNKILIKKETSKDYDGIIKIRLKE